MNLEQTDEAAQHVAIASLINPVMQVIITILERLLLL